MSQRPNRKTSVRNRAILLGALLLAMSAVWIASGQPDGLEAAADSLGFADQARSAGLAVSPDYRWPGLTGQYAEAAAGVIGTGLVFLAMLLLGRLSERRTQRHRAAESDGNRV